MTPLARAGTGISVVALAIGAACLFHRRHEPVQAIMRDSASHSVAPVVLDSLGMCQMTLPPGWRTGKDGVIWAYGPENSSAEILAGAGSGTWEDEKTTAKNLFAGSSLRLLRDDSSALTLEVALPAQPGYSVLEVRPGKAGYCWVQLHSNSVDARARLATDFAAIGASVQSRQ